MCGGLRSRERRIDRLLASADHELVKRIFDVRSGVGFAPQPGDIRFVLREQRLCGAFVMERVVSELWMKRVYLLTFDVAQHGFRHRASP